MDEQLAATGGCMSLIGLVVFVVTIIVGGLFRTELSYTPAMPERLSEELPFDESVTARHWLFGLIKGEQPDLDGILTRHVRDQERITQFTIVTRHSVVDNLLCGMT